MTTCEQVRERLPEHVLGTLDDVEDVSVRRHLRGCAGCRQEMAALGDGISLFARASHDRTPPPELRDRVLTNLSNEWVDAPPRTRPRLPRTWLAAAAAVALVVASLGFGLSQQHRASVAAEDASSYQNLLHILGGKEFRVGKLVAEPGSGRTVDGSVVVYDSSEDQSWVAVFVRAPGETGEASAVLHAPDGRSIRLWPVNLAADGAGSTWLTTTTKLAGFDRLTVTSPDGSPLASATIAPA